MEKLGKYEAFARKVLEKQEERDSKKKRVHLRSQVKKGRELSTRYMPHEIESEPEHSGQLGHSVEAYLAAADKYRTNRQHQCGVNSLEKAFKGIEKLEKTAKRVGSYDDSTERSELKSLKALDHRIERIANSAYESGNLLEAEEAAELGKRVEKRIYNLEKELTEYRFSASAVAGIAGITLGAFFLSPNLTGNVIGNLAVSASNVLGALLFTVGLVAFFFWTKKK